MDQDEKRTIDEMMAYAKTATEKGISILLIRRQDSNDEQDVAVTNVTDPELLRRLSDVLILTEGNDD